MSLMSSAASERAEGGGKSRKRKRSVPPHGVPSPSSALPPPPSSAESLPDTIRGKPLEASSLAYFRSLHSSLRSAADTGSDVELIVAAAYGELRGVEYRLMVNKHGSRCVEALIAHSTPSQLASLLSATRAASFALLVDRHASHPIQRLIERMPRLLMDEQRAGKQAEAGSLSASLLAFCRSLSEPPTVEQSAAVSQLSQPPSSCWPLLLMQEQGSFAVRALARLMSGATDITRQPERNRRPTADSGAGGVSSSVSHVSLLRPVLSALVDSVAALKEADRIELAFHVTAAPALSEVLVALSAHPHSHSLLESLLLSLLLSTAGHTSAAAAGEGDSPSNAVSVSSHGAAHAAQLIRHRVGSHLFEHILRAARQLPATPTSGTATDHLTFATLARDILQSDLTELATHPTGNHVLQTALALCTHSEQHFVKRACSTLGSRCQALIAFVSQKRRDRLVSQLQQSVQAEDGPQLLHALLTSNFGQGTAQADREHAPNESDVKEAPAAAAAAAATSSGEISEQSATSSSSSYSASRPSHWSSGRVSYFGSLLLQALLSLPLSDNSVSAALVSLPVDALCRLACDGSGGPVVECLLRVHSVSSFSHPLSTQQRLIDVLLPRVAELALSASGSYVVERMYLQSDVRRKRAIAESLAADEKRLRHCKPASMLMRRCRVKQLRTSSKDWMVAEGARKRKAELFSDIING